MNTPHSQTRAMLTNTMVSGEGTHDRVLLGTKVAEGVRKQDALAGEGAGGGGEPEWASVPRCGTGGSVGKIYQAVSLRLCAFLYVY